MLTKEMRMLDADPARITMSLFWYGIYAIQVVYFPCWMTFSLARLFGANPRIY